jgi:hypothetical protein
MAGLIQDASSRFPGPVRRMQLTFAVSDNVPYNRWYEFLGVDAVHARLAQLGYSHAPPIARYASPDPQANRRTGGGVPLALDGREVEMWPAVVGDERAGQGPPCIIAPEPCG